MARKKYPIITLCGSTRFKSEFLRVQKNLTLEGNIVISVGLFGHSGDTEVWESMTEDTMTKTKMMLDDMHKTKIDMADFIFVINPEGYIGNSTWSEICYAKMTKKEIKSIFPIDRNIIDQKVCEHIKQAEKLAWKQMDFISHRQPYFDKEDMTYLIAGGEEIFDPWYCDNEKLTAGTDYPLHGNLRNGFDPFSVYGRKKMARFVEEIIMRNQIYTPDSSRECGNKREVLLEKVDFYCRELHMDYPDGYPDAISDDELQDFVSCWSEYDPLPDLK